MRGILAQKRALLDRPLENLANNASPGARRRLRAERQRVLWRVTDEQRLAYCSRVIRASGNGVQLRSRDGVGGWHGLQHCGSVWACPVCSARILVVRALEIGGVLGAAVHRGHSLAFCTFTMRHHSGQGLDELWAAAQKAWRRATGGKAWQEAKRLGIVGNVRVWEVGHGRNGWHVHVHMVLVLEAGAAEHLEDIGSGMFGRWSKGLTDAGLEAPLRIGQDWKLAHGRNAAVELGQYLAKITEDDTTGFGLELTHGMAGRASVEHRTYTPWVLLDHLDATGEAWALHRWREWERVSKGKRQIGWSRGLRDEFAPDLVEVSDEAIVQVEQGTAEDDVLHLLAGDWYQLVARPMGPVLVLEALEAGGLRSATQVLDDFGINYEHTNHGGTHDEQGEGQDRSAGADGGVQ